MSEKTPRATMSANSPSSCRKKTAKKEKILGFFPPFLKLLNGVLMDSNLFQQIGVEFLLYYLLRYLSISLLKENYQNWVFAPQHYCFSKIE